jgi:hypothetical protein
VPYQLYLRTHTHYRQGDTTTTATPSELMHEDNPYSVGDTAIHGGAEFTVTEIYVGEQGVTIVECDRHIHLHPETGTPA